MSKDLIKYKKIVSDIQLENYKAFFTSIEDPFPAKSRIDDLVQYFNSFEYREKANVFSDFFTRFSHNIKNFQEKPLDISIEPEVPAEPDISNYSITKDGIIDEQWDTIINIPARILEVTENHVILECLIDSENRKFENRRYDIDLIKGIVALSLDSLLIIKIFKRKGEIKFKFIDGKRIIKPGLFEENFFNDLPRFKSERAYNK